MQLRGLPQTTLAIFVVSGFRLVPDVRPKSLVSSRVHLWHMTFLLLRIFITAFPYH